MTDSNNDYPIFLGSEITQPKAEDALFHVIPVPFEESVSYGGGTAQGPSAILKASWQLEQWDGKSKPCELGIHTQAVVDCRAKAETVIENIAQATKKACVLGKIPVVLGGEHTVTYGVIKGIIESGITEIGVVQIDAHADLRDRYENNPLSHASVMKRIVDLGVPLFQLGIRALCEEEVETRKAYNVQYIDAEDLVPNNINEIELPNDFPQYVFFTLDIDGIDPSVFPSTGTPVPGGLGWYQTLKLFESIVKQRTVVGFDIMEFSPIKGFHAYDFAASLLTYKMMGIMQRKRQVD